MGTGYVGLVTGACLAEVGNDVLCLDVVESKIDLINQGGMPIFEPGLKEMVQRNRAAGRLRFTTDIEAAVRFGSVQFIAVGTPPDEDGSADLRHVLSAARNIGRCMTESRLIVDKSTVPVGTADKVKAAISEELALRGVQIPFQVVSNPEFLKEGAAIEDFMRPDRIVIGSDDPEAAATMRMLYSPFQRNHDRILTMDVRSAELTKYAANAMLATRISFMNELANLAEVLGANIEAVRKGMGSDQRIGYHFLYAGAGYGGSCFPKDVQALIRTAVESGSELPVLEAVEKVNHAQKKILGKKIVARFGGDLGGLRFALWGLAFKPNTDDMREAPSRELVEELVSRGAKVSAYDPVAMSEARRVFSGLRNIDFSPSPMDAVRGADALVVVTEWTEFRSPDFNELSKLLKARTVFDGRNLYDPEVMRRSGLEYHSIGRAAVQLK